MSVTEEIKSRLDIVDVIGEHVSLRKSGNSYSGFCPFHPNTRTPAFVVFPNTQTWRCFGACAEGGDVFSFLMKKEGWDFKEALQRLADRTGVTLYEPSAVEMAQQEVEDRLGRLLAAAADYYHQLLLHAPQGEFARQYLAGRGLEVATIETFKLGFALDSWDASRTHFGAQGYSNEELLEAGLLTHNEDRGTTYDRFRNRLMIPIRDVDGRFVGFGARTLEKDGIPKYLNSPQTTLFDKSRLLFGLDQARRHIREARQAIIVEGYLDVMQAWQHGFRNVVAQMGTALTESQLALLKRYTRRFVIALDPDAAGVQATLRSLEVARDALDRSAEVRFDARGLVHHEGRLQADIRVVTLPDGQDPDDLIRTDPARWPVLLEQARPVVQYVIDVATADLDMGDAKAKTAVAQQILPLIDDVADPIEREHYRQQLARALRVDERALRQVMPARSARPRPVQPPLASAPEAARPADGGNSRSRTAVSAAPWERAVILRERNYLRQCLSHPQLLAAIDQRLAQQNQPVIGEVDFTDPIDRVVWRAMRRQWDEGNVVSPEELCDSLDRPLRERVQQLLAQPAIPISQHERYPDNLILSILDWRLEKIKQLLSEVRQLLQDEQAEENVEILELYRQQLQTLPLTMAGINKAKWSMSAMSRRRAEKTK